MAEPPNILHDLEVTSYADVAFGRSRSGRSSPVFTSSPLTNLVVNSNTPPPGLHSSSVPHFQQIDSKEHDEDFSNLGYTHRHIIQHQNFQPRAKIRDLRIPGRVSSVSPAPKRSRNASPPPTRSRSARPSTLSTGNLNLAIVPASPSPNAQVSTPTIWQPGGESKSYAKICQLNNTPKSVVVPTEILKPAIVDLKMAPSEKEIFPVTVHVEPVCIENKTYETVPIEKVKATVYHHPSIPGLVIQIKEPSSESPVSKRSHRKKHKRSKSRSMSRCETPDDVFVCPTPPLRVFSTSDEERELIAQAQESHSSRSTRVRNKQKINKKFPSTSAKNFTKLPHQQDKEITAHPTQFLCAEKKINVPLIDIDVEFVTDEGTDGAHHLEEFKLEPEVIQNDAHVRQDGNENSDLRTESIVKKERKSTKKEEMEVVDEKIQNEDWVENFVSKFTESEPENLNFVNSLSSTEINDQSKFIDVKLEPSNSGMDSNIDTPGVAEFTILNQSEFINIEPWNPGMDNNIDTSIVSEYALLNQSEPTSLSELIVVNSSEGISNLLPQYEILNNETPTISSSHLPLIESTQKNENPVEELSYPMKMLEYDSVHTEDIICTSPLISEDSKSKIEESLAKKLKSKEDATKFYQLFHNKIPMLPKFHTSREQKSSEFLPLVIKPEAYDEKLSNEEKFLGIEEYENSAQVEQLLIPLQQTSTISFSPKEPTEGQDLCTLGEFTIYSEEKKNEDDEWQNTRTTTEVDDVSLKFSPDKIFYDPRVAKEKNLHSRLLTQTNHTSSSPLQSILVEESDQQSIQITSESTQASVETILTNSSNNLVDNPSETSCQNLSKNLFEQSDISTNTQPTVLKE